MAPLVFVLAAINVVLVVSVVRLRTQLGRVRQRIDQIAPSPIVDARLSAPTVPPRDRARTVDDGGRALSAEAMIRVRRALRDGQKIEAVRIVRDETGMGLRDSKRYVETLETM